jgi:hypothetical protein
LKGRLEVGAIADLVATVFGAAAGAFPAVRGAGAWAPVGQYIVTIAIRAGIVNIIAFEVPAFTFDFTILRPHLLLGGS